MKFFFSRILPLPFIFVGAAVFLLGIENFIRARNSVAWPIIAGHVINSRVTAYSSMLSNHSRTSYRAEVLYTYQLSGVTYSSNHIGFEDPGSTDPSQAEAIASKYTEGAFVNVHYNPQSPELSVLETGVHGWNYCIPLVGFFFFFIGCIMLWGIPKLVRQMPAQAPSNTNAG